MMGNAVARKVTPASLRETLESVINVGEDELSNTMQEIVTAIALMYREPIEAYNAILDVLITHELDPFIRE